MDGSDILTAIFNDFRSSELDTRIGNTGIAGVYQYNITDGQIAGDTITGTDADDTLMGTLFGDVIDGGAGNDIIDALGGDDVVRGGDGNDEIRTYGDYIQRWGDYGNNLLDGGAGDDTIRTGDGNDTIIGGDGNDLINAGFGANLIMRATGMISSASATAAAPLSRQAQVTTGSTGRSLTIKCRTGTCPTIHMS